MRKRTVFISFFTSCTQPCPSDLSAHTHPVCDVCVCAHSGSRCIHTGRRRQRLTEGVSEAWCWRAVIVTTTNHILLWCCMNGIGYLHEAIWLADASVGAWKVASAPRFRHALRQALTPTPRVNAASIANLNELSISVPTKSQISKYNSGGRLSRPGDLPFWRLFRETWSSSKLNGASKDSLSICEIRGSSNLSKYCLQIGSSICFGFIQICVKTFKYVINCHRVRGDLIIQWFFCANICLGLAFFQPKGQ